MHPINTCNHFSFPIILYTQKTITPAQQAEDTEETKTMFPLPLIGIAHGGRILLSKYGSNTYQRQKFVPSGIKQERKPIFNPVFKPALNNIRIANPFETIAIGLSSALSQITAKNTGEDYNSVIKKFIPADSILISPRYPAGSKKYLLADVDGDSNNELVASYRLDDGINTIILKKQADTWHNIGEAYIPECNELNYRGIANIYEEGPKSLLLGVSSKDRAPVLHAYTINEGNLAEIFAHNYHRFDLSSPAANRNNNRSPSLIFWEKDENDCFKINTFAWNGNEFKQIQNDKNYFLKKVVPYYASKVKQNPYNSRNWYNLAESLFNAEEYEDARIAADIGLELNPDDELAFYLNNLKSRIP